MKPITIFLEIDFTKRDDWPWWKPGYFKGVFKAGYFKRVWWTCLALAWVRTELYEYNRYIESGATNWVYPEQKLWCAWCGKAGDHQSGWCKDLKRSITGVHGNHSP